MNRVLVTPRSITKNGNSALERLREAGYEVVFTTPGEQPSEDELIALLPGCVGYLAGVEKISARVLEAAPDLKVISRNGTGVDNIDLAAAERLGIRVCRAEGANARGVAELAFGLVLSLARGIPFSDRAIKQGGWERRQGIELEGRTLGLVGCGRIGRLVASFALAFGMEVLAHDVVRDESLASLAGFTYRPLEEVLANSDFISLHCPPPEDGRPLIDASALRTVKRGACIINTARAGLVDDEAVLNAMEEGRLTGFATDVYELEPPVARRLLANDRVIATPHVGGLTSESVSRAVGVAIENLLQYLS